MGPLSVECEWLLLFSITEREVVDPLSMLSNWYSFECVSPEEDGNLDALFCIFLMGGC